MSIFLIYFEARLEADALDKHAHYCGERCYPYRWICTERVGSAELRQLCKWNAVLRELAALTEDDWLLPQPAQRGILIAKDVGGWKVNSGGMGVRNTPDNENLLQELRSRIQAVDDKSSVHAGEGDQYCVNEVVQPRGLLQTDDVCDLFAINTSLAWTRPDSLKVHFMGLAELYRAACMAHWDRLSLQRG